MLEKHLPKIRTAIPDAIAFAGVADAEPFPELELASTGTTVSGLSSGACMAVQVPAAFSQIVVSRLN